MHEGLWGLDESGEKGIEMREWGRAIGHGSWGERSRVPTPPETDGPLFVTGWVKEKRCQGGAREVIKI